MRKRFLAGTGLILMITLLIGSLGNTYAETSPVITVGEVQEDVRGEEGAGADLEVADAGTGAAVGGSEAGAVETDAANVDSRADASKADSETDISEADSGADASEADLETVASETESETDATEAAAPVTRTRSLGTFTTTGYCPCRKCSGGWGRQTSTGAIARPNHTVAVDPRVIPYGTKLMINGIIYTAEDMGGGVKGKHIDIFYETHAQAQRQGSQKQEVFLVE